MLSEEAIQENYALFKKYIYGYIKRDGVNDLLNWLDTTDICYAPATTKYYGVYPGGFIEHCLAVCSRMFNTVKNDFENFDTFGFSKESIAIVSLLHDLDKVNKYAISSRNKKDENGNWYQENYYTAKSTFDRLVFGNPAQNTIFIIEKFFHLTYHEKLAIMYHSGGIYTNVDDVYMAMNAHKICELAYYLYEADYYCICHGYDTGYVENDIMAQYIAPQGVSEDSESKDTTVETNTPTTQNNA